MQVLFEHQGVWYRFHWGPHRPDALDVDSHCNIRESCVIATSSNSRDSTIQLAHGAFIQNCEYVDYRCLFAHRHRRSSRNGLGGTNTGFVRGFHQPASVMGLSRLVWNCHQIAQLGGTGGILSRQWCWAPLRVMTPLATQQGAMCQSKWMQRVPFLAGSGVCFIKQKQASACQTPGTGPHCICNEAMHLWFGCVLN